MTFVVFRHNGQHGCRQGFRHHRPPLSRWKWIATVLVTIALGAPRILQGQFAAADTPREATVDLQAEAELLRLANIERLKLGIAPLQFDSQVTEAARLHSRLMAAHGAISHLYAGEPDLLERIGAQGLRMDAAAENIALNDSAAEAHDAVMHSPHHRENLLNPKYNAAGMAVIRLHGRIYVTQDFVRRFGNLSADEAEEKVAEGLNQLRQANRLKALSRVDAHTILRDHACQMATADRVNTNQPAGLEFFRYLVTSTTFQPEQLPDGAIRPALDPTVSRYSVGVCASVPGGKSAGVLWVSLVLY